MLGPVDCDLFSGEGSLSIMVNGVYQTCLLYTSDAADERSSVDLGGRRIIKKNKKDKKKKKKNNITTTDRQHHDTAKEYVSEHTMQQISYNYKKINTD